MNEKKYKVAVIGATGNVGREILQTLFDRNFPIESITPIASDRSIGQQVSFGDQSLDITTPEKVDFQTFDLILSSCGSSAIQKILTTYLLPIPHAKRPILIDNSSAFRMDDDVPLIVPEVNAQTAEMIRNAQGRKIIANPNCSTAQIVVPLKEIHQINPIERVVAATYQSVSGGGKDAMDELFYQTKGIYTNQPVRPEKFTKKIAFNVIPHIDVFLENGMTKEEWKMREETKKILDPKIELFATCVRVPVFVGHSIALHISCEQPIDENLIRETLKEASGISVIDYRDDEGYVTPDECSGEDLIYISRMRKDISVENGFAFWCVADNLRKGAALNAVQIAETLYEQGLLS